MEEINSKKKFGILVDEKALLTITENEEIANMFLSVAKKAVAVICCRVSPLQKSQVVKLLKNYDKSKITLAIGDGGNDVSMIMEAHIGIGIYGEEGLRAAQSSDYAIGEFQVLRRLLFFHGYLNLMRNSCMVIYFFYKNFVFTIIHFFFGFLNDFSGQTIIDDLFISLYNLVFTSIPLGARGILDITLRPEDGKIVELLIPSLYKEQKDNPLFTIKKIIISLFKGIIHALLNYFITLYTTNVILNKDGYESNLWSISVCLYTNILLIVTFDLIVMTKYHTFINWLVIIFLTFNSYIIFLVIVQRVSIFKSMATMKVTFDSLLVWLNFLLVLGICFSIDLFILAFNALFLKSLKHDIQLLKDKDNISEEYINTLNNPIKELLYEKLFDKGINEEEEKNENETKNGNAEKEKEKTNININKDEVNKKEKIVKKIGFKNQDFDINIINNNSQNNGVNNKIKIKTKKIVKKVRTIKKPIDGSGNEALNLKENGNNNMIININNEQKGDSTTKTGKTINIVNNNNVLSKSLIYNNDTNKKNQKPFGNINFSKKKIKKKVTNPINISNGRDESQKNSFSNQKDISDRRLLK